MIRICAANPRPWLARYRGQKPVFVCIVSFTETGLIPQISAAGDTPQARRHTALADCEFLYTGAILPRLAAGISPAVITRAVLTEQTIPMHLLSTGLPAPLTVPHIALPQAIAKPVHTGQAMTLSQAAMLLESGLHWGQQLAQQCLNSYLIVSECVVGGTTTAQAVLTALGYEVAGLMSSSHLAGNHRQKQHLIEQGLSVWRQRGDFSPLAAVAAVGDPMQAVAAGMVLSASQYCGVLLAGGSQMLAVYALAKAIAQARSQPKMRRSLFWNPEQVVVGTTRWVIEDASADTTAIARSVGAPYLASQINFSQSPYLQLRAYERGFVKEGIGAGGCAIAAHLHQNWTATQLRHAVEAQLRQAIWQ